MKKKRTTNSYNSHKILLSAIVGLCVLISLLAGIFIFGKQKSTAAGKTHTIVLTEEGFEPQELRIKKGDIVEFSTTREEEFWPASDLHPSHEIFPDFDPRKPVSPSDTWKFQFKETGTWKYHDHLFSYYRGVIIVEEGGALLNTSNCDEDTNKIACYEQLINETLALQGISKTFDMVEKLFAADPVFAANCHDYAHTIGKEAYKKFTKKEDFELTSKTYYCGYGFYHGFMETLLQTTNNIEEARDFCDYADEKLKQETTDAGGACLHGIGHGAVDGSDPRAWGDVKKMIAPGEEMCKQVSRDEAELYRCITGAFNAIEILSWDPKYKITNLAEDPYSFCDQQPYKWREACYTNISFMIVFQKNRNDFATTALDIQNKIQNDSDFAIRYSVMAALFHEYIRIYQDDPNYIKNAVALCKTLHPKLKNSCIDGLSGGHMKYGEPTNEYKKGLAFCASDLLSSEEADICYRHILTRLRIWYSSQKSFDICKSVDANYQKYCSNYQYQ